MVPWLLDIGLKLSFDSTFGQFAACEAMVNIEGHAQHDGAEWVLRVRAAAPLISMKPPDPEDVLKIISVGHLPGRPEKTVHPDKHGVTKRGVQIQYSNIWTKMVKLGKGGRPHWSPEHTDELESWLTTGKRHRPECPRIVPALALAHAPQDDPAAEAHASPQAPASSADAPQGDAATQAPASPLAPASPKTSSPASAAGKCDDSVSVSDDKTSTSGESSTDSSSDSGDDKATKADCHAKSRKVDGVAEATEGQKDQPEEDYAHYDASDLIDLAEAVISDSDHEHRHMLLSIMQQLRNRLP